MEIMAARGQAIFFKLKTAFILPDCAGPHWICTFVVSSGSELLARVPYNSFWFLFLQTGPRSAVGNMSDNRCESDCRSRGREFDPGPVPYFRGD